MVFARQYVTSGAKNQERLTGCSGLGLVPWISCPPLSHTQTAELTPHVYRLWISDFTALPALPSTTRLSCTARHLTYSSPQIRYHPSQGWLLSLSVSEVRATPAPPPTPIETLLHLAQGHLANQLCILYGQLPRPGTPGLGNTFG
jgi:hypothetical protein